VEIFGTDYPTPDGTCIRDYIHVWDLAQAHGAAMNWLLEKGDETQGVFESFNLGSENGYSVREVIQACEEVTGKKIPVIERERRPGDPPRLIADSQKAQNVLGFAKERQNLLEILGSAWVWEQKRLQPRRRAIFLDRDGTLNEDPGYLSDPDLLQLIPTVGEGLAALKRAGYLLIVVSNQSGVGRGLIPSGALSRIHERMGKLLEAWNVNIDHYELCFHHPEENCPCRKPKPKMLLDAAAALNVDLSQSYMVGDKGTDLEVGFAAGCLGSILVRTGEGENTAGKIQKGGASFIADSLLQAAQWILAQENANP
jgi:histidinol-phosphate phosphatase family protein